MKAALALSVLVLTGCNFGDPNAKPIYGSLGLPVNCRAYVQSAVDGYRAKRYTAEETMNGLERNCGVYGQIWGLTE